MNYATLMGANPTKYHSVVNQLGQTIDLYEHPILGDSAKVIAVYHEEKYAAYIDFYDTDDFYEDSDYNPCYINGKFQCAFELI